MTDLVAYWLEDIELEDRLSQTTRNLYERNMRTLVLPVLGKLTLRELGVNRFDHFLKQLAKQSCNRAKQARVVLRLALGFWRCDTRSCRVIRWITWPGCTANHTSRTPSRQLHGLVSAGSDWYLCASAEGTVRFFTAVRIKHAALLVEPCSEPELDVAQAWRDHRARFLDQFTPVNVDARLRAERWDDAGVEYPLQPDGSVWEPAG